MAARPIRLLLSHPKFLALLVVLALVDLGVGADRASAEIYKWKDAAGRLHFAQDLSQVPPEYRSQAAGDVRSDGAGPAIQVYRPAPAALSPRPAASPAARGASSPGGGKTYRIRVPKGGSSMRVNVRLNDRVVAPFLIDTGASDVSLPAWVAKELGLDLEGARTHFYNTANGTIQAPVVTLDSVELGGARAENVPASVSSTMSVGLLGLSYFNHFRYRIDPVAGIVTLQENGLVESGRIRGGRNASQWRNEFRGLAARRDMIESVLSETSSSKSRRKAQLEDAIEEVERELEVLEDEADDARVPMRWRD